MAESEKVLAAGRMFPIMDGPDIPWSVIAPFDDQAKRNHGGQNLEHLASRGGLSVYEALHVIERVGYTSPARVTLESLSITERLGRLNAHVSRSLASCDASLRAALAENERLRAEITEATQLRERIHQVHLGRHVRLSQALGTDPGYSADETIDEAIKRISTTSRAVGQSEERTNG